MIQIFEETIKDNQPPPPNHPPIMSCLKIWAQHPQTSVLTAAVSTFGRLLGAPPPHTHKHTADCCGQCGAQPSDGRLSSVAVFCVSYSTFAYNVRPPEGVRHGPRQSFAALDVGVRPALTPKVKRYKDPKSKIIPYKLFIYSFIYLF